jgi:glycosyltransferase involved in cell wall biosynthesis
MSGMKVSILIAVYNEASTVDELLERVWQERIPDSIREIIIIESNSTDGSRAIVSDFARRHPDGPDRTVRLILEPRPEGKGHAIRAGIAAATGEVILIQDADLEYDVGDYPLLLQPIFEGRAAFVLGSRHMGSNRWLIRQFSRRGFQAAFMNLGGMLFHTLFNVVFASRLTDPTSMFKVFRADCLHGLQLTCNRFDFDYELLGKLMRAGFQPLEVAVSYRSRGFDQGKKIRVLRDPPGWVWAIFKARFSRINAEIKAEIPRAAHRRETSAPSPASIQPGHTPPAAAYSRSPR